MDTSRTITYLEGSSAMELVHAIYATSFRVFRAEVIAQCVKVVEGEEAGSAGYAFRPTKDGQWPPVEVLRKISGGSAIWTYRFAGKLTSRSSSKVACSRSQSRQ